MFGDRERAEQGSKDAVVASTAAVLRVDAGATRAPRPVGGAAVPNAAGVGVAEALLAAGGWKRQVSPRPRWLVRHAAGTSCFGARAGSYRRVQRGPGRCVQSRWRAATVEGALDD